MVKLYLSWLRLSLQKPCKKIKLQTLYHGVGIPTEGCAVALVLCYFNFDTLIAKL